MKQSTKKSMLLLQGKKLNISNLEKIMLFRVRWDSEICIIFYISKLVTIVIPPNVDHN